MATLPASSSLRPSFSRTAFPFTNSHAPTSKHSFCTRATADENNPDPSTQSDNTPTESANETEVEFESRLSQVRLRYRSGTGKKVEIQKSKKMAVSSKFESGIYLPPVPLKELVSGGVKVEFEFSSYSKKFNGRIAMLGLSTLLLVELATGKSVIKYHSPAIVLIQV